MMLWVLAVGALIYCGGAAAFLIGVLIRDFIKWGW